MPHSDSRLRLAPFMKPPPFFTSASPCSESTRSAVVESISRMLIVAFDCTTLPPMPRKPPPVLSMLNLSMPPSRMYFTPRILPTLAADAGSTAPDCARPCSLRTRASLSRSTTENLSDSSLFSENSVSIWLRAAGPMSLKNHQLLSAWFSNSQMAILILPCANPETGNARTRATAAARLRTVFLMMHLVITAVRKSGVLLVTGEQHRHIVASIEIQHRPDQAIGSLAEVRFFLERLLNHVVGEHAVQSVGAHHQRLAIFQIHLVHRDVQLVARADHVGQNVMHRMLFQRGGVDARFLTEHGHPRIVARQLAELRALEQVQAAVADAREGQTFAFDERHDHRRT